MKILAIETTCDETGVSLVNAKDGLKNPQFKVISNAVSSQIKIHRPFGGVVPNLAKREHLKNLPAVLKKALAGERITNIDLIAIAVGPGLEPALWTGINFAKDLAKLNKKPLIGINHLEGHLYSNILKNIKVDSVFPAITLLVSGGHTILLLMKSLTEWKKLGETRDDSVGEAFDKVARMLDLPYPGGPEIEKIAAYGSSTSINFPRPMINHKNYDFSFSGLKTSVLYYLKNRSRPPIRKVSRSPSGHGSSKAQSCNFVAGLGEARERGRESSGRVSRWTNETPSFREADLSDIAASFQQAAIDVLTAKTIHAGQQFKIKSIMLCGGVAANKELRRQLKAKSLKLKARFFVPDFKYNTDNAAMLGAAAYINHLKKKKLRIIAQPNLNL